MKRLAISLIIFEIALVFVHLAVYRVMIAAFGTPPGAWSGVLAATFVLLAFTFMSSSLAARYSRSRIAAAYYAFSAYWFGLINFLFVGALVFFAAIRVFYLFNVVSIEPALLGAVAFGGAFLVHSYGTWKSGRGETTKVSVSLSGLPESWRGRKVAFITDVHLGDVLREGFAARVAKKVRNIGPYALFIGGDLYDGPACDEEKLIEPFRALVRDLPGGAWFVTGNHEYYMTDLVPALRAVRGVGIKVLNNEVADIDGVQLLGVDDFAAHGAAEFKKVLGAISIDPKRPSILLKHVPLNLDVAAEKGISLTLCGHTHRGQIFPFTFLTGRIFKGYDYGLKPLGDMQVYTSSGVGTWGPPLRLGTRSEIAVIEFTS